MGCREAPRAAGGVSGGRRRWPPARFTARSGVRNDAGDSLVPPAAWPGRSGVGRCASESIHQRGIVEACFAGVLVSVGWRVAWGASGPTGGKGVEGLLGRTLLAAQWGAVGSEWAGVAPLGAPAWQS